MVGDSLNRRYLEISAKTGIPVKKIVDLFSILKDGAIENNELVRRLGVSRNVLNQVKKDLSEYLKPTTKMTELSDAGKRAVASWFSGRELPEDALWVFLKGKRFERIVGLLKRHADLRPKPDRRLDQFTSTPETTALRVGLMDFFADIRGKRLLFLGDNDLTSVAVSVFGSAETVGVLDIDMRVLSTIEDICKAEGFSIGAEEYDARQPLPSTQRGRYDVVFTDPPFTPEGILLFVSRAIEALDPKNLAGRIYLSYGNSDRAKERVLLIQEVLTDAGLMIRWVFDKFNRYEGAESIGSAGSLYVCDRTPKTRPLVRGTFSKAIYTTGEE